MKKSEKRSYFIEESTRSEQDKEIEPVKKSELTEKYSLIFEEIELPKINLSENQFSEMGIEYHPNEFVSSIQIKKFSQSQNSKVVTIYVSMSWFTFEINILNENGLSPARKWMSPKEQGAFSAIYRYLDHFGREFAIKNIAYRNQNFNSDSEIQSENEMAIKEYCFYKIFSCLKIGPKVGDYFGYDLIIFDDSIEFAIEMCHKIQDSTLKKNCCTQLRADLMLMHSLGIVHNDIKEDNIMFSPAYDKLVFIDFNLSKVLKEKIGEKTLTSFIGSYSTSSPQMQRIFFHRVSEFIDLYHNDAYALNIFCKNTESNKNIKWGESKKQQGPKEQKKGKKQQAKSALQKTKLPSSEINNLCQCFYLHIKLRYLITRKNVLLCQDHLQKYLKRMKVTEQMRKTNELLVKINRELIIPTHPHQQIAEFNNIIQETLSMLIEVNLTNKLIKIKEIMLSVFDPLPQLRKLIKKVHQNKWLILPSNSAIAEKFKSRLKFEAALTMSSTTVKMLELVSAVCICRLSKQQSKQIVNTLIAEIDGSSTVTLQLLWKLENLVSYYNASDEDYEKIFDKILLKSKLKTPSKLKPKQKFREILKLQVKLSRQQTQQQKQAEYKQMSKKSLLLESMCLRLERHTEICCKFQDHSYLQICEKLRRVLGEAKNWFEEFMLIVVRLKKHLNISQYSKADRKFSYFLEHDLSLKNEEFLTQFASLESQIIAKIESLRQLFTHNFATNLSFFMLAICNCILLQSIETGLSQKMDLKRQESIEQLTAFINRYNFNNEDLACFLVVIHHDYIKKYAIQQKKYKLIRHEAVSIQIYCYTFISNLFLECWSNPIKSQGLAFSEVVEYISRKNQTYQLAWSILQANVSASKFSSQQKFIFNFYDKELFTKVYISEQNICIFYLQFFKTYYEHRPQKIRKFISRLTKAFEKDFTPPYPTEYWRILIRGNSKLGKEQQCELVAGEAVGQYPLIVNQKIEQLYCEIVQVCFHFSYFRKELSPNTKIVERLIDHYISQQNFVCFCSKNSYLFCLYYLLVKQSNQKLVQLWFSIIERPSFPTYKFWHFRFHQCLKQFFYILLTNNKFENQVTVLTSFIQQILLKISRPLELNARGYACTIVYHLYQIVAFFNIPGLSNKGEIIRKFSIFLAKNIEHSAFDLRRELQIDWYHFAIRALKEEECSFKFHVSPDKINQRIKYFIIRQFRQKTFRDYCDYTQAIKTMFLSNSKNDLHLSVRKSLENMEKYSHNKMSDIPYNGFINSQQREQHLFNSKTNKNQFYFYQNLLVCPLPHRESKTWRIKAQNLGVADQSYYYSVYEIKMQTMWDIKTRSKKPMLKYQILNGQLFKIQEEKRMLLMKEPILSKTVTLRICCQSFTITWSDDQGNETKHVDARFGNRESEFAVYLNYSNDRTYFCFDDENN